MAKPVVYTWNANATAFFAPTQNTAGAANLILNSTQPIPFRGNVSRVVSLTSIGFDNSGASIRIRGTLNGKAVSAIIVGPNNNTVETTQLFDSVTDIRVNVAVNGLSAGSGSVGKTQWFNYDYHAPNSSLSVAVFLPTPGITYSFLSTWDDVTTNPTPHAFNGIVNPLPNDPEAFNNYMFGATTSQSAYISFPVRHACISITGSAVNILPLTATFIQQGIK